MKAVEFSYPGSDGVEIKAYKWTVSPEVSPKGIVQLAHGMAEHAGRYQRFAGALVEAGFAVYANDHRGHGKTAGSPDKLGFFAEKDGWDKVVEDIYCLTAIIKKENNSLPLFLFGHSMGSFLARDYISCHGEELKGVVLSGTGGNPGLMGKIGLLLARLEIFFNDKKTPSPLLNRLSFGSYNKTFKPVRTEFDWLSRDEAEVDKYIADPLCGAIFSAGFFYDLLTGLIKINKKEVMEKIPPELPIYLISGEKDPVGQNTVGVQQLFREYQKIGLQQVSCRFYPDCRHELLNELNREEITADIIDWFASLL